MNKKSKIFSLLAIMLLASGCNSNAPEATSTLPPSTSEPTSSTTPEPPIDPDDIPEDFSDYVESDQTGKMLFAQCHNNANGKIGDPMPYYENGTMYVYFLDDVVRTSGTFHPISLLKSTDFIHFEETDNVVPCTANKTSPDWALGTGSIIKDKNGLYHYFYTGHNDKKDSGLPFYEKIQHATSPDLINWTKIDADGFFGVSNDFRDPHCIYMPEKDEYWLLITQMYNTSGTIEKYVSKDLKTWTHEGQFYRNPRNYHNMECPTLFQFNGYWYLTFSEQEPKRVVRYRYRKSLTEGEWIIPEQDYLDAEGLYAGKVAGPGDRMFMYGWCGSKGRSRDTSSYGWGGHLVGHELIAREDGLLGIKAIQEVADDTSTRYPHKVLGEDSIVRKALFDQAGFNTLAFEPFKKGRYAKMVFDYTPYSKVGNSGIMFNIDDKDSYGTLAIDLDNGNNRIAFYNNVDKENKKLGDVEIQMPFQFEKDKEVHCELYYGSSMAVLYANGEVCLSTRLYASVDKPFSIYSLNKRCDFRHVKFYE